MKSKQMFSGLRTWIALCVVLAIPLGASAARQSADVSVALNASTLAPGKTAVLAVVIDVHAGLHAQSHQPLDKNLIALELAMDNSPGVTFGAVKYPAGKIVTYPALGTISIYEGRAIVFVPVQVASDARLGDVTLSGKLTLQACNASSCYPPEHPTFSIKTAIGTSELSPATQPDLFLGYVPAAAPSTAPSAVVAPMGNGDTQVNFFGSDFNLRDQSIFLVLGLAFVAGTLFNIVPCVLPVLPVKAVGFYEASQHNRARTVLLGGVFSLGLISVFVVLGMGVVLSKQLFGRQISWGQQFSHPTFVWSLSIVLILLGVGMLGWFSLPLPNSIYGFDFKHDTLSGNFLWGALTAVLSTPCTAPLFPPVLAYGVTLPHWEGFVLVVMVGVGMAWPYFLLSALPEVARAFPRTGAFAELTKQMMGFLLIGSGAFFAGQRLVRDPHQWWVVLAVVGVACLFLVIRSGQLYKTQRAVFAAAAVAVVLFGGSFALCSRLARPSAVAWQPYSAEALDYARLRGQWVVIDFTANWCLNCKYVEQTVYRDQRVIDAVSSPTMTMLQADLTDSSAAGWKLLYELGSNGIPFTAVYAPGHDKPTGLDSIYTANTLLATLHTSK